MKLFFVRHGETVDNVAQIYAGVRDSALTNQGVLQAERLGQHLASLDVKVKHVLSSDLQRAFKTAEAIRLAQAVTAEGVEDTCCQVTTQLPVLREQDFGFYEGKPFYARPTNSTATGREAHQQQHKDDEGFQDVESRESMIARMNRFLGDHLMPLLIDSASSEDTMVIVSHGIILSVLWRCFLLRFSPGSFSVSPGLLPVGRTLEYLGGWSNTGYLEVKVDRPTDSSTTLEHPPGSDDNKEPEPVLMPLPTLKGWRAFIKTVNGQDHLQGLKRTRGGVGSSKHDEGQQKIESFFKKRKSM
ncbi:MAG: hypothetical protein M4579_001482 [Chaenotheca gracillima]|nr:MAG: hypothetical protein M4579_001482 [Chaenotheca gracillima]